jgi:hypothetical protein
VPDDTVQLFGRPLWRAAQSSSALSARRGHSPRRRSRTNCPARKPPRGATGVPGHENGFRQLTGPRQAEATEDHQPCPNRSRSWYGRNAAQLRRVSSPIAGRCPHVAVLPYHPRTIKLRLTGRQTSTTRRCRPCTARSRTWQVIRAASAARADVIRDEPILVTLG